MIIHEDELPQAALDGMCIHFADILPCIAFTEAFDERPVRTDVDTVVFEDRDLTMQDVFELFTERGRSFLLGILGILQQSYARFWRRRDICIRKISGRGCNT